MLTRMINPVGWLVASAICTTFSGFQSLMVLAWLQPVCLLQFFHSVQIFEINQARAAICLLIAGVVNAIGSTVANGILFELFFGKFKGITVYFAFSLILWIALSMASVTSMNYARRFGKGAFQPFGFASLWTAVWYIWDRVSPMASLISPAYSQHAFEPLVMTASIWGIDGIVFLMAWGAALLYLTMNMDDATEPTSNSAKVRGVQELHKDQACKVRQLTSLWKPFLTLAFVSLLYGEGRIVLGNFYQKSLVETMKPTVAASCIIGQYPDTNPDAMLNKTAARVAAGDWIVLWSESAVKVQGDEGEKELLSRASAVASQGHINRQGDNGPYLGIAYNKYDKHLGMMHNTLSLILPNGSLGFKYEKSHPVPFVESNVIASVSQQMATANTEYGTLGSAICYDFQYPDFMRQAWQKRADIVLQPAWTWGSIGNPVFVADAYRAVESGFTMLRCNSVGISAVVTPFYKLINYREAGYGGIMLMELPIAKAVGVVYPLVAPLLGWLLNVLAMLYLLLAFLPTSSVLAVMSKCPNVVQNIKPYKPMHTKQ